MRWPKLITVVLLLLFLLLLLLLKSQHALTDIILPEQLHNCVAVLTATAGQSCTALPTGIYSCTVSVHFATQYV